MLRRGRVPLVSVVVPARNSERFVGATLQSIQSQTFQDWECILVDDGSTDGTTRIAAGFAVSDPRFRVLRRGRMGKSLSRNEGFFRAHSGASYVSFMDSDDVWVPEALEVLVTRLEKSSEAVGVHGLGDFIDTRGVCCHPGAFADYGRRRRVFRGEGARELLDHEATTLESLAWVGTVFPPGVLLARRKKFLCGALYDPGLRHCEDWDVSIRLSRQGPIAFVNRVILGYRRHDSNESNDWNGMRRYVRKVHHKTFFSDSNSLEQKRMLREGWRAFQCFKLREKWDLGWQHSGWARWRAFSRAAVAAPVHWSRYCRGSPPRSWGDLPGAALPP